MTLCFLVPERFLLSFFFTVSVSLFHAPLNNVLSPTLGMVGGVTIFSGVVMIRGEASSLSQFLSLESGGVVIN